MDLEKLRRKVRYYSWKAVKDPELILPFVTDKVKSPVLEAVCAKKKRELRDQKKLSRKLFENEEYLLIVLDACRYDKLEEVSEEYFDEKPEPVWSTARNTFEYAKNFWGEGLYTQKYVSGAVPINKNVWEPGEQPNLYEHYVPAEHLLNIVEAWQEAWDEDLGAVLPEKVTEIALEEMEDQTIVHYFQPHAPYIGEKSYEVAEEHKKPGENSAADSLVWEAVERGEVSDEELHGMYESNLERVLDSVQKLLKETDHQKVVITADHGEALGEFGIYGHPNYLNHPKCRVVPWLEIDRS